MDIFNLLKTRNYSFSLAFNELAASYNAVNLAQEYNDFPCNQRLSKALVDAVSDQYNKQASVYGLLELREAISGYYNSKYGASFDPQKEVTVASSATQAIYTAISTHVKEGDEVLLFEPTYGYYVRAIEERGARPVFVKLAAPEYAVEWDHVQKLITAQTKMIIINTPHNPSGTILSVDDIEKLQKIITGTNILVLSDEVYENFVYDGEEHPVPAQFEGLKNKTIVVSSLSKSFNVSGWKVAYVMCNEELMSKYRDTQLYQVSSVNAPMQYAFAKFLDNGDALLAKSSEIYQQKRDYFVSELKDTPFDLIPSKGTYFQLVNYNGVSQEKEIDFAIRLAKENGVLGMPLSVFYHNTNDTQTLRFNFGVEDKKLKQALKSLSEVNWE